MLWMSTGPASLAARIDHRSREADLQFSSSGGVPDSTDPPLFLPLDLRGLRRPNSRLRIPAFQSFGDPEMVVLSATQPPSNARPPWIRC